MLKVTILHSSTSNERLLPKELKHLLPHPIRKLVFHTGHNSNHLPPSLPDIQRLPWWVMVCVLGAAAAVIFLARNLRYLVPAVTAVIALLVFLRPRSPPGRVRSRR